MDSCSDVGCVRGRVDLALDRALNMSSIPLVEGVTLVRSSRPGVSTEGREQEDVFSKFMRLVSTHDINIELANVNGGKKLEYCLKT